MSNHLGNEAAGAQWLTQGHQASKRQCLLALSSELSLQCSMNQFRSHLSPSSLQSVLNCFPQHCITQPEGFSTAFSLQITPQLLQGYFPFLNFCKLLFQSCSPVPPNLKLSSGGIFDIRRHCISVASVHIKLKEIEECHCHVFLSLAFHWCLLVGLDLPQRGMQTTMSSPFNS